MKQKINQAYADVDFVAGGLSEQADGEFQIVNHEPGEIFGFINTCCVVVMNLCQDSSVLLSYSCQVMWDSWLMKKQKVWQARLLQKVVEQ